MASRLLKMEGAFVHPNPEGEFLIKFQGSLLLKWNDKESPLSESLSQSILGAGYKLRAEKCAQIDGSLRKMLSRIKVRVKGKSSTVRNSIKSEIHCLRLSRNDFEMLPQSTIEDLQQKNEKLKKGLVASENKVGASKIGTGYKVFFFL